MLKMQCEQMVELFPRCLRDSLSDDESVRLTRHLDECEHCRRDLELAAASEAEWETLRELRDRLSTPQPESRGGHIEAEDAWDFDASATDFAVQYLTPANSPDAIGQLDDLEILDVVGRGGMGIVLKGRNPRLQCLVAVKVLRPDLAAHGVARKRFLREARSTAAILHPNVMPIHAVQESGRLLYLVMPFLDCESLERRIRRAGPLEPREVLTVGLQVARALEAAHAQGLVHRDVKPENILLERTGNRVWLADFGLARTIDDVSLTRSGVIAGTPLYMSPEQARGEPIDGRSDLFSLGSVLYMMCTGRPPFRAETTYGVLRRIMESRPRTMRDLEPGLPDWMEPLVDRFLQKQPERRLPTATAAAELLEQSLRFHQQPETQELPRALTASARRRLSKRRTVTASSRSPWQPWHAFLIGGLFMLALLIPAASFAPQLLILLTLAAPAGPEVLPQPAQPVVESLEPVVESLEPVVESLEPVVESLEPVVESLEPVVESLEIVPSEPAVLIVVPEAGDSQKDKSVAMESKYASADEAYRVAVGFLSQMEYAQSQEPLEEALKLAPDDQYRVKVYRALLPAYTIAPEWTLKLKALEFIIRNSEQDAERSLARTELMSFVRQRGKTKDTVKHFEEELKVNKEDESALYILTEVYSRLTNEPQKSAAMLEQLTKLKQKSGKELSVADSAKLAGEYVRVRKYKEGAELFEASAERDKSMAAWNYKEAAAAWMKANDKVRALAAAKASSAAEPEKRSELLVYFWHRGIADVFLEVGEPALAIPHYEQAVANTKIEGYRKESEEKLARAREQAK